MLLLLCILCVLPCLALRTPLQAVNSLLREKGSPRELIELGETLRSAALQPADRRKAAGAILERVQRALVGTGGAAVRSELLADGRFHDLLLCSAFGVAGQCGSSAEVDLASSVRVVRALAVLSDGGYSLHRGVLDELLPVLLRRQAQAISGGKASLSGSDIEALEWSYNRLLATNEGFGALVDSSA